MAQVRTSDTEHDTDTDVTPHQLSVFNSAVFSGRLNL